MQFVLRQRNSASNVEDRWPWRSLEPGILARGHQEEGAGIPGTKYLTIYWERETRRELLVGAQDHARFCAEGESKEKVECGVESGQQ